MTDYRTMMDKEMLGAWDLNGRDAVVTIESVKAGKVGHDGGGKKASRKPILAFQGKKKRLACNITNAKTIAAMYGNHVEKWVGQRITLYPSTTTFGSETVDCVRVRPAIPGAGPDSTDTLDREVDPAMREKQNAARDAAEREPGCEG